MAHALTHRDLQSGCLESRATDVGSGHALDWSWQASHWPGGLQSEGLHSGCLVNDNLTLDMQSPMGSAVWASIVWESNV